MVPIKLEISASILGGLLARPTVSASVRLAGIPCKLELAVPHYAREIGAHYRELIRGDVAAFARKVDVAPPFEHFGLVVRFASEVELCAYELRAGVVTLDASIRELVRVFGPVSFRNAVLPKAQRDDGHKGRFQHLNFHIDRSGNQVDQYSVYTRNPADSEQRPPRTSSTLFISNLVAYLQNLKETGERGPLHSNHTLFSSETLDTLLGRIIFAQLWNEPEGTGEVVVQDNRYVRHASCYANPFAKSWRLGVRFAA